MTWVAEDTFNTYSDGDLTGNNGGTGWAAAWSGSTNFDVQGTTVYEGAKAVNNTTNANANISRQLSAAVATTGTLYFAMRRSLNNSGQIVTNIRNQLNQNAAQVVMNASGNITAGSGGDTVTLVTGYSVNTWYVFRLAFDIAAGTYVVAYSTDAYGSAGSFSADTSAIPMTNTPVSIQYVLYDKDANAGTDLWDYVSPTSPFSGGGGTNHNALLTLDIG